MYNKTCSARLFQKCSLPHFNVQVVFKFPWFLLLLFYQVGRGSGSSLPSSGMLGNKVNLGGLLTSLRELSAHVSGGYGWPACADRVAPLCGRFVGLSSQLHYLLSSFRLLG